MGPGEWLESHNYVAEPTLQTSYSRKESGSTENIIVSMLLKQV